MFHIGRTTVRVGAEKSSRFIINKFALNLTILALLLMTRKFTLVLKFDQKYVHDFLILCYLVFFRHGASNVRLRLRGFSRGFTSYLRNGWSVKLWAMGNCILSIRSVECNARLILRTVCCNIGNKITPPIPSHFTAGSCSNV
jgi:hypothetical protein